MTAAIYARKSTEQVGVSDDQQSIPRQLEHAREFAARQGWTVDEAHVYSDDGISGAEFARRPGFLRLMNALKPRAPFQVLVMSEESRLGREAIETAYALKQLIQAGVRVFFYLEKRERTLDSPTDKIMLSLTTFADEVERERTRQRTYDALLRKARAGYVTGGRVFGYDNVEVLGPDGRRSHVERRINEAEADVVRRIFELSAAGVGQQRIARELNAAGAIAPRPRGDGKPKGWASSTVREVLFRELYRGVISWDRKRKRNQWGQIERSAKPEQEWKRFPAPQLAIVTDAQWAATHAQLERARKRYELDTKGTRIRRRDRDSNYLLVGFARCGVCGGTLSVQSRTGYRPGERTFVYRCLANWQRGQHVCTNSQLWPMEALNNEVLTVLGDEVLSPAKVQETVAAARRQYEARAAGDTRADLERELAQVTAEQERLTDAIVSGAKLPVLMKRLQATEQRRVELADALRARSADPKPPSWRAIEQRVRQKLADWRSAFTGDVTQARDAFRKLLTGPVRFTPIEENGQRGARFEGLVGLVALLGEFSAPKELTRAGIEPATL